MNNQIDDENEMPFDPDVERPAELDELNFENDKPTPSFNDLSPETFDQTFETYGQENLLHTQPTADSSQSLNNEDVTDDDLSPETLIPEDGARSPFEPGGDIPTDQDLTIVDEDEIGEGYGLDEAELARVKPLDGKPWDGSETK